MRERLAYPITEAAEQLGIGRTFLYVLINRGDLETITVGRRRLVTRRALEEYLERASAGVA